MKKIETLKRLQIIHNRIQQGTTGTPCEFAKTLNISRRALYNYIELLKTYKAPIRYSKSDKNFYYTHDFDLKISVSVTALSNGEAINIMGGTLFFSRVHGTCTEHIYL